MGPSVAEDSTSLLTFLDVASNKIKSALQRPFRQKRKHNIFHRKYHRRQQSSKKSLQLQHCRRTIVKSAEMNDQKRTMDALFDFRWNSAATDERPPLRMRNLPPSFFKEPIEDDPLRDLLGPDSPLEELLSSPSWKAIVTHSFSFPQQNTLEIDDFSSAAPISRPSCRFQDVGGCDPIHPFASYRVAGGHDDETWSVGAAANVHRSFELVNNKTSFGPCYGQETLGLFHVDDGWQPPV